MAANSSLWTQVKLPRLPKLAKDMEVDVAIVGGGITGLTAAYLLHKAGKKVALVEKGRLARAETGHTTAHVTYLTDERPHELVKGFGRDHAKGIWEANHAGQNQIAAIVRELKIDCDFSMTPGYLHASLDSDRDERKALKKDLDAANQMGFSARFVDSCPIVNRPGIELPNQAKFHPLKYLAGLVKSLQEDQVPIFEQSEAKDFNDDPLSFKANKRTVRCQMLFLATHVPLTGDAGLISAMTFQSRLAPYSTYAIGAKVPGPPLPEAVFYDTSDPYYYLRVERAPRGSYVIFGGRDHKTGQVDNTDECYEALEAKLHEILPAAVPDKRWSGQVIETMDGAPYIGYTAQRQFVATGFAGNGMTFGTLGAMMARDAATGQKNPWEKLLGVGRKKLRGTWDYLTENLDYPYYLIKDRLSSPDGDSARQVKRGEGKILKVDGQRLAVSRDTAGKVTCVSPYCTHMGCLVHWNQGESTWDCPCHGSRFAADGKVLGGPAETPLELIKLPKDVEASSAKPKSPVAISRKADNPAAASRRAKTKR